MIEVALADARVVFTDRADGDVREPASLARLAARTGRTIAQGRQVHGAFVRRVDAAAPSADVEADGQATARTDVAVLVRAADCLPVALAGGGVVAMVHAGWRGLAAGVLEEGVASLLALGATDPLHAAIGPGAGPCCYEVGDDVRAAFGATGRTLDIKGIARERLAAAGVASVEDVGVCTICDEDHFSFRREGAAAGRQAGMAWLL